MVGGEGWQEEVRNREEWKEAPENSKESSHSARANGMNEFIFVLFGLFVLGRSTC